MTTIRDVALRVIDGFDGAGGDSRDPKILRKIHHRLMEERRMHSEDSELPTKAEFQYHRRNSEDSENYSARANIAVESDMAVCDSSAV